MNYTRRWNKDSVHSREMTNIVSDNQSRWLPTSVASLMGECQIGPRVTPAINIEIPLVRIVSDFSQNIRVDIEVVNHTRRCSIRNMRQ